MYLHLGSDVLIKKADIVAIFDLEKTIDGLGLKEKTLNENLKLNKKIKHVCEPGKEKSFIITTKNHYFSPISSTTLLKRSHY